MNEERTQKIIDFTSRWWCTFFLILPVWIITEQYWVSLSKNILLAVRYPYPFFISPFFFILDNLTLIIHEAGHTIFGIFQWRFLTILGGTLMQMLIPFLIFTSAWWKHQKVLAQFSLFWLGFAWFDSAAYCMDAYYQQLPLIGNLPKSAHDFTNMLSSLNILNHHATVAWAMFVIGCIILILSLVWPALYEQKKIDEDEFIDLKKELAKHGVI